MLVPLLVVFAAGLVFFVVEVVGQVARPIDATNEYLADIKAGRYREAYDRSCTYGPVPSREQFMTTLRAYDTRFGPLTSYDISGIDSEDRFTYTTGTWTRGGQEWSVSFRLREEGGDWKVCSIEGSR